MILRNCQSKLISLINSYQVEAFPKTCLLIGENGCGMNEVINYIAHKLHADTIDITNDVSNDLIDYMASSTANNLYLIDSTKLTEKSQNVILKFIEEPGDNCHIIITTNNKFNLLDTIVNRCIQFKFEPYTATSLALFLEPGDDVRILELCHTPGQLEQYRHINIDNLMQLCYKVVNFMAKAPYINALSIANKLNYANDYDKYDVDIFFAALNREITMEFRTQVTGYLSKLYTITNDYIKKLNKDARLNKRNLVESFITDAWRLSRCQ